MDTNLKSRLLKLTHDDMYMIISNSGIAVSLLSKKADGASQGKITEVGVDYIEWTHKFGGVRLIPFHSITAISLD
jgi:hypothetical protein